MNKFFITTIQLILLIDNIQSHVGQTIKAAKGIGKAINNPLFKMVSKNIKKTVGAIRQNKNIMKNLVYGLEGKQLKAGNNLGRSSVKYLGQEGIKNSRYMAPLAARGAKNLVRAESKKSIQMRSSDQMSGKQLEPLVKKSVNFMKGNELNSLINLVSNSKSALPLLFAGAGLNRLTQSNLSENFIGFGSNLVRFIYFIIIKFL